MVKKIGPIAHRTSEFFKNPWPQSLWCWAQNLIVVLFFYFFQRMQFYLWNSNAFVKEPEAGILRAFFTGLRFDLSAILMVSSLALLWILFVPLKKLRNWGGFLLMTLPHSFFMVINHGDTEFVNFTGRRMTAEGLFIIKEASGKMSGLVGDYWILFASVTLSIGLFGFVSFRIWKKSLYEKQSLHFSFIDLLTIKVLLSRGALFFGVLIFAIIGMRGGLQEKPIGFVTANVFVTPILNNLVLNSTFTVLKSAGRTSVPRYQFFKTNDEVLRILSPSADEPPIVAIGKKWETLRKTPQNVVLIIVEGLALEYMGIVNEAPGYTPFLDQLTKKSLFFPHAFANGKRSMEGVAALIAGVPALMEEPFISSNFAANYFVGLGSLLSQKGYQTSFFHGGHNGTMYFDTFTQSAGYQNYFGFNEFPDKTQDDGSWGIYDGPFLQWMIQKVNLQKQPFHSAIFTLSSHQPYRIPKGLEGQFPEGPIEILKTISYADKSIEDFFKSAETQAWYQNTLFIITADHTQKHFRENYKNSVGDYKIPMILFHPQLVGEWNQQVSNKVVQQIDLIPSVLDFLNIEVQEHNPLAKSFFRLSSGTVLNFVDQNYLMVEKDHLLWGHPDRGIKLFKVDDENFEKPLSESDENHSRLQEKLKASVQYFNTGMWDNRLYFPSKSAVSPR